MEKSSEAVEQRKGKWQQLPRPLQTFLFRGIFILVAWKVLYLLLLKPLHQPDAMLTYSTAQLTTWLFQFFSAGLQPMMQPKGADVLITALMHGTRVTVISIANACNALELIILYAGFIFSAPIPFRKQIPYVLTGAVLIVATNVLRCLALIYIYISFPHFFPFAHHYIFTLIIYLIIFLLWKQFIQDWIRYEKR